MSDEAKTQANNEVASIGLLSDKLVALAVDAFDRQRSEKENSPEWNYENGRRNGLMSAQKLLLEILSDNREITPTAKPDGVDRKLGGG